MKKELGIYDRFTVWFCERVLGFTLFPPALRENKILGDAAVRGEMATQERGS